MSSNSQETICKLELFLLWKETEGSASGKIDCITQKVMSSYDVDVKSIPNVAMEIKQFVANTCKHFKKIWQKCNRTQSLILDRHGEYLNQPFQLPESIIDQLFTTATGAQRGRKSLPFGECTDSVKRRKTMELRANHSTDELVYAMQMKLREAGQMSAASLVKEVTQANPSKVAEMVSTWQDIADGDKCIRPYSEIEALALILDTNMTKAQYMKIQKQAASRNADIYPPYYKVLAAKKSCYPESLSVSETVAEVKLQSLLDHTTSRIIAANIDSLSNLSELELLNVVLTVKWGFDGSTGHSEYKQKFDDDNGTKTDSSIFVTSIVPIKAESNGKIIFQNERTSSTRYCRPLRIQFISETAHVSLLEKSYVDQQITALQPTEVVINGRIVKITYQMLMTMVDGKVCNSVTSTKSVQRCYICYATPIQMNNIESVKARTVDKTTFQFGLSTLHAWIRFMEYFLHLSYRLDVKKWQARGLECEQVKNRKTKIQQSFRSEMGLLVDRPRSGGAGSSNDGNTARSFFQEWKKSATITGLNPDMLYRCKSILKAMASGYEIDSDRFEQYCLETARRLIELYPWYYLPVTVDKILIHGATIVSSFLVPIGQLSEEAQESRNKDIKRFRKDHTRKHSRKATNEDLMNRLFETSDPLVTSLRSIPKKFIQQLSVDAKSLLLQIEDDTGDINDLNSDFVSDSDSD